ncbi:hypothetical protein BC827DRAFT_1138482, partial [Russula dissimulans]
FEITYPTKGAQVAMDTVFPLQWTKGLKDNIHYVDIELVRLSEDGLFLVALNASASSNGINLYLDSVPADDDYYVVLLDSIHGIVYAKSQAFSIVNGTSNSSTPQPLASKPTVTITGTPNPTAQFATTFPVSSNGVRPWRPSSATLLSAVLMSLALLSGAAAVL